jgi:hypothetical protein
MVIASSGGASKGSGGRDVSLTEPSLLGKPSPGVEDTLARESDVLDVALTSGRGGAISHDTVCSLLTECLQDMSYAIDAMFCLLDPTCRGSHGQF